MSNIRASDLLQTSCFACTCLQAVCRLGLTYDFLSIVCDIVGIAVASGVVQAGAGVFVLLCCSCL
jgi:hypothetical protein